MDVVFAIMSLAHSLTHLLRDLVLLDSFELFVVLIRKNLRPIQIPRSTPSRVPPAAKKSF